MADTILKLTTKGEALKAKIEQGEGTIPLEFTRIVSASGTSPNPTSLTDVINPKLEFGVTARSTEGARTTINTILTNAGDPDKDIPPLAVGYTMSQVGFYAIDPDEGEVLYRISQYDNPIYVPAASERGWTYTPSFNMVTGNATTVIIEINATGGVPMDVFIEHAEAPVLSAVGIHGVRFKDGYLQFWNDTDWELLPSSVFRIIGEKLSNSVPFGAIEPNENAHTLAFQPGFAMVDSKIINLV